MIHKVLITLFSLAILAIIVFSVKSAGEYYFTSQLERPHLPAHQMWKPSGLYGHGLGILGTGLVLGLLVYSIRKRWKWLRKFGSLKTWLNYHIFMGITGPLLIILHTTFKFNGLVSVSFWSMMAVMISGFIGKYIYVQIPRAKDGVELSAKEMEKKIDSLRNSLVDRYKFDAKHIDMLLEKDQIQKTTTSQFKTFFLMPVENIFLRIRIGQQIKKTGLLKKDIPPNEIKQIRKILLQHIILTRRIDSLELFHKLFHYWHVIHKPFAYIMIIILFLHVGLTIFMGFTWIF